MKENPLTKYFVFSDVHGEYDALINSLRMAGYEGGNPQHKLISLGDAFDRGPNSREVYEYLNTERAICIKGNHDVMFQQYLEEGMKHRHVLFNILHNGLGATIRSFTGLNETIYSVDQLDRARRDVPYSVLPWLQKLPLYFETASFIFCHAGIHPQLENWKDTDEHFMLWDIEHSDEKCLFTNKIIVIGHHHAQRVREIANNKGIKEVELNRSTYNPKNCDNRKHFLYYGNTDDNRPYKNGNKIAVDGMTNLTGKVNVLVIEDYPVEGRYVKDDIDEAVEEINPELKATNGYYQVSYNNDNLYQWVSSTGVFTANDFFNDATVTMANTTTL